jgi:UDP-N-acetylmuramate: L-alanyl-gamma-D-glutamyl-meso-diaminopimelate ligase
LHDRYQPSAHLYFLPIGGTAMAPLAGLLHEMGHRVEGVDSQLYPPMSTLIEELGIPVRSGFDPDQIPSDIDRVVIGNAVPRTNPEVEAILERGIPYLSQAETVAHEVLARGQDSLVVAGTHGKTTTASMLAWILEDQARDPSYLIGGMPRWNRRPFRLGGGRQIVIEGDEYNTAFFDRGPKFLHYRPHIFLLGPVEFDHADIYRDLDAVMTAFRAGVAQVPRHGSVVVNAFSDNAVVAAHGAASTVTTVGPDSNCTLELGGFTDRIGSASARMRWRGSEFELVVPMNGRHNLHNAAMAAAAAATAGLPMSDAVDSIARFPGVARRQQVVGSAGGVTVVDDFAHHPTALAATIEAARARWPSHRLVVAFEPRSLTAARRSFQEPYLEALSAADVVCVTAPFHRGRLEPSEILDRQALQRDLADRGVESIMPAEGEDAVAALAIRLKPGDLVLGCSSGSFDDFHRRLLTALESG